MSFECAWSPCEQEVLGDGLLCYFHTKRAEDLIGGYIPGPGLSTYREPDAKVKALIESSRRRDDEDK